MVITAKEAQNIVDGDLQWMREDDRPLIRELYLKMKNGGFRPKTIVDYTREPFVYAPGNVRVTLDYNIRTGLQCTDFLNPDCVTVPAGDPVTILEVKWDGVRRSFREGERIEAADSDGHCVAVRIADGIRIQRIGVV